MEIVAPVLEPDDSNSDLVRMAIAAIVLGGRNAVVEHVCVKLRYRLADGEVRFLKFDGEPELEE